MGKLFKPMQVSWQGELGGIVCRYVRGQYVVSRPPRGGHSTFSQLQLAQMARFGFAARVMAAANSYIKTGFKFSTSEYGSPQNMWMKIALREAIVNTGTTVSLVFNLVKWSMGSLINVGNPTATQGTGHTVDIAWTDNASASRDSSSEDYVCLMIYNEVKNEAMISTSDYIRSNEEATITYPVTWVGDKAACYVFTTAPNGAIIGPSQMISEITSLT